MKKVLIALVKVVLTLSILGYLVWDAWSGQQKAAAAGQQGGLLPHPHWTLLCMAWVCCASAVALTLIRWHFLVKSLDVPFPLRDALRVGFLGYLFNLAPMGILGGDLLKVVMLAREQPGSKAKALASVAVDRLLGLYMLFVVASAAILMTGFWRSPDTRVQWISYVAFGLAAGGTVGLVLLVVVSRNDRPPLSHATKLGAALDNLLSAFHMYGRKPQVLLAAALITAGVHSCFATGIYLIARGLVGPIHTWAMHFVISPLSASGGVLPLPAGPMEGTLSVLYRIVPNAAGITVRGEGSLIGLGYRLCTLLIAAVGMGYYFGSRRELAEVMHDSELEAASDDAVSNPVTPAVAQLT